MARYRSRASLRRLVVALGLLATLTGTASAAPAGGSTVSAARPQPAPCNGTTTAAGVCLIPPLTLTDTVPAPTMAASAIAATPRYAG